MMGASFPVSVKGASFPIRPQVLRDSGLLESRGTSKCRPSGIADALCAYHEKYRFISHYSLHPDGDEVACTLVFPEYPFTLEPMEYASLNLINLGIEQCGLLLADQQVLAGRIKGHWSSIEEYRGLVCGGHWLAGKILTRVYQPIPMRQAIRVSMTSTKAKWIRDDYFVSFRAKSPDLFDSSLLAILVRTLPHLEKVSE